MKLASLVARVTALALITAAATGCSSKPDTTDKQVAAASPPAPAGTPAPSGPAPSATAPAPGVDTKSVPAEFPPECVEYAGLIDKLKSCDKLGSARDGLIQGYAGLRASWPQVPVAERAGVALQCRTQADSLRAAAAATCGW